MLTAKQDKLIAALMQEPTVEKAAAAAGCCERTAYRWLADAEFAASWRQVREQAFGAALGALQAAAGRAVGCLLAVVDDTGAPAQVRVHAASKVLEFGKQAAAEGVAGRLADLEREVAELRAASQGLRVA